MLAYKIYGSEPGFAEGLVFYSCVHDLQSHPDLWLDECPYIQPQICARLPEGLRVELACDDDTASRSLMMRPQRTTHSAAQAA